MWMDIEDHLIPFLKLNAHERSVYYHLFRHSRVLGNRTVAVSIDSLARATGLSTQVRKHLRKLEAKGAVRIVKKGGQGTTVEIFAPAEIPSCVKQRSEGGEIDLEAVDFYTDKAGRSAILEREAGKCFYCLCQIDSDSAVLDHAIPQVQKLDNSYRNIVACCHECNPLKAGASAEDFLRAPYRRKRLSGDELEDRLAVLDALRRGDLKPRIPS